MSVIIRLQNLPWSANASDVRAFFRGLEIPDGGVLITGGENGDAFIAFSTDEDARQAMMLNGAKLKETQVSLLLSSRAEMQKVIGTAQQQTTSFMNFSTQQPAVTATPTLPVISLQITIPVIQAQSADVNRFTPFVGLLTDQQLNVAKSIITSSSLSGILAQQILNQQQNMPVLTSTSVRHDAYKSMHNQYNSMNQQYVDNSVDNMSKGMQSNDTKINRNSRSRSRTRDRRDRARRSRSRDRSRRYRDRSRDRSRSRERRRSRSRRRRSPSSDRGDSSRSHGRDRNSRDNARNNRSYDMDQRPSLNSNKSTDESRPNPAIENNFNVVSGGADHQKSLNYPDIGGSNKNFNNKVNDGPKSVYKNFNQSQNDFSSKMMGNEFSPATPRVPFKDNDNSTDVGCCIRITNMNNKTHYTAIRRFFGGLQIPDYGIKLLNDEHGNRRNDIVVRFARPDIARKALASNGKMLNGQIVCVMSISDSEYENERSEKNNMAYMKCRSQRDAEAELKQTHMHRVFSGCESTCSEETYDTAKQQYDDIYTSNETSQGPHPPYPNQQSGTIAQTGFAVDSSGVGSYGVNDTLSFSTAMDANQIMKTVKAIGVTEPPTSCSIQAPDAPIPTPPDCPPQILTREQLAPSTPAVHIENEKHAFSPQLQEFCLKHPIAIVKGLTAALKLDLRLFSTKTLVEVNPRQSIEVRRQVHQSPDEKRVWTCISERQQTTIAKYAQYQVSSFQDSQKEEKDKTTDIHTRNSGVNGKKMKKKNGNKMLRFGTNIDLFDEQKWRLQLNELTKIPAFARVVSAANMLSHVGHNILGMNTVQLYMKVPGSRTPGHQENNNFCSININIGPGDSEWFAVPDAYWGGIQRLCEKNNIDYLHDSWWPIQEDLNNANIPVHRFTQRPGDLVWVNSGCVHWVQAVGVCNNIAWNVGPLTARQYSLAIERYEWNKLQHFKSIVPMVHLSWNLARHIKVYNAEMFELMKNCLLQTLKHVIATLEYVKLKGIQVDRVKHKASHFCEQCNLEVFNILFIREQEKRHVVHCMGCARKQTTSLSGFVCLEKYRLTELMHVYDAFVLHSPPPAVSPAAPTT